MFFFIPFNCYNFNPRRQLYDLFIVIKNFNIQHLTLIHCHPMHFFLTYDYFIPQFTENLFFYYSLFKKGDDDDYD